MKKLSRINRINSALRIGLVSLIAIMTTVGIVSAVTTIGSNISTGGTLGVTGATTLGNNVTIPAYYSLDTAASGDLNIGTSTATAITIGGLQATTTFPFIVRANYGLDSTGALYLGTSTATSLTIGRKTVVITIDGNLTIPAAYSLDVATAGSLNIGTSTATSLTIGKSGVTTTFPGLASANYGVDSTGALYLGTSTATSLTVGKAGITTTVSGLMVSSANASSTLHSFGAGTTVQKMIFGTCTPTLDSINASTTLSAICTGSEGVDATTWKVFVTPYITNPDIIFSSASSTANGIQVSVLNTAVSNVGAINPNDNLWSWMAIK